MTRRPTPGIVGRFPHQTNLTILVAGLGSNELHSVVRCRDFQPNSPQPHRLRSRSRNPVANHHWFRTDGELDWRDAMMKTSGREACRVAAHRYRRPGLHRHQIRPSLYGEEVRLGCCWL